MISNQKDNAINIERLRFETLWATTSKLKLELLKSIYLLHTLYRERFSKIFDLRLYLECTIFEKMPQPLLRSLRSKDVQG